MVSATDLESKDRQSKRKFEHRQRPSVFALSKKLYRRYYVLLSPNNGFESDSLT